MFDNTAEARHENSLCKTYRECWVAIVRDFDGNFVSLLRLVVSRLGLQQASSRRVQFELAVVIVDELDGVTLRFVLVRVGEVANHSTSWRILNDLQAEMLWNSTRNKESHTVLYFNLY